MQFAKDSLYIALRDRLAAINPSRTIMVNGLEQPAILITENTSVTADPPAADCFRVTFGATETVNGFARSEQPMAVLDCTIGYHTSGTCLEANDRGRKLNALDSELLQICNPPCTAKSDFTKTPVLPLGSMLFWDRPRFGELDDNNGRLGREAKLTVYFYPEVNS